MEIQLFAFWWGGKGTKHVERVAGIWRWVLFE